GGQRLKRDSAANEESGGMSAARVAGFSKKDDSDRSRLFLAAGGQRLKRDSAANEESCFLSFT
ncbi:MAG: hypothetical protein ACI4LA_04585, partial [Emergencia sp.]